MPTSPNRRRTAAAGTQRRRTVDRYLQNRRREMEAAIAVLERASTRLRQSVEIEVNCDEWCAAYLLGESHCDKAAPLLTDFIATRDSGFSMHSNEYTPDFEHFPFAAALRKIGIAAVDPLLENIRSSEPGCVAFELSCATLESILGAPLAAMAVRERLGGGLTQLEQKRIESAVRTIETGHFLWSAFSCSDFRWQ